MPTTPAALRTPAAQNLLAATMAGVAVLARPARFPVWARRSLSLANTAGTAGSVFLGSKKDDGSARSLAGLTPTKSTATTTASAGSALAAASGGLMLVTSKLGVRADARAERYLIGKGVRHPRLWMAVGVVGLVFVVKQLQDLATAKATDRAQQFVAAKQGEPGAPAPAAAPKPGLIPTPTQVSPSASRLSAAAGSRPAPAAEDQPVMPVVSTNSGTHPDPALLDVEAQEHRETEGHASQGRNMEDIAEDTGRPVADPADD